MERPYSGATTTAPAPRAGATSPHVARGSDAWHRTRTEPAHAVAAAMDASEIDTAKQQVQGQMAAQYIQEVMQARIPAR